MSVRLLLCTDLDRTLLPNGPQTESPGARQLFARLAARPEIQLAYVTGRHLELLVGAVEAYALPLPDFAICDVGTSIYRNDPPGWVLQEGWAERLAADWHDLGGRELHRLLADLEQLTLQEEAKQGRFKLSYYAPAELDPRPLLDEIESRLGRNGIRAKLVWSVDETGPIGLLDLLPQHSGKLAAIEYLLQLTGFDPHQVLFAGDSGNDLPVLVSTLPAVLVANATETVRAEARRLARIKGTGPQLYLARGGYRGMNGNYGAGILEGAVHFYPEVDNWLAERSEA
jgi:HAD superfamily hydrolase (TIGR01484 family)